MSDTASAPDVNIVQLPAFLVAGLICEFPEESPPRLWDRLLARKDELTAISGPAWGFGVAIPMQSPDHFKYLAGWEVDSTKDLPEGFVAWEVPATSYAVLQCNDVADIDRVLSYFYGQWSQVSPDWESSGGYMAECYLASYPEDHQIYLHLPVKPRQAPRQAIEGRLVLEDVPRIGFHRHLSPTPGSVYALLEYLGETPDYDYLMGASGAAFRHAYEKMDGGNIDLMRYGMAPFRRLFEALGFDYTITGWESRQAVLDVIKTSLEAGRPALVFGIVGPPECGLVTGYSARWRSPHRLELLPGARLAWLLRAEGLVRASAEAGSRCNDSGRPSATPGPSRSGRQ